MPEAPDSNDPAAAGPFAGRTFIILNPVAGQDGPARLRRLIGGAFAARGAPFDLAATERPGHAAELARRAARLGYRAVCVAGGDGTLAEAANGLVGSDVPLALIPRGTANQVAHNLRIPTDLERAVDVAVNGVATPVDVGRIDGRTFTLVAGAGYDAAVMASATRHLKERFGFAAYVFAAVKEALRSEPARFRLRADGHDLEIEAVTVMVANMGELFAGFLPVAVPLAPVPARSWQDGLLDVVALRPAGAARLAATVWRAARGLFHPDEGFLHLQARHVTIEADPPLPVQIDGDPAGRTPVAAEALPGGIRILTPA